MDTNYYYSFKFQIECFNLIEHGTNFRFIVAANVITYIVFTVEEPPIQHEQTISEVYIANSSSKNIRQTTEETRLCWYNALSAYKRSDGSDPTCGATTRNYKFFNTDCRVPSDREAEI